MTEPSSTKGVLNAALKALLAAADTTWWLKAPATFISEISQLPEVQRSALLSATPGELREALQEHIELTAQQMASNSTILNEIKRGIDSIVGAIQQLDVDSPTHPQLVAVIPVGGSAERMVPLSLGMPKTLIPVHDKPLLVRILENLDPRIFRKAFVLCNHYHPMVRNYVRAFRDDILIEVECRLESEPTPPTRALDQLLEERDRLSDPLLLHYGDILINNVNWINVWNHYLESSRTHNILAMLLVSSVINSSVAVVTKSYEDIAERFDQKPKILVHGFANCGVAFLTHEFIEYHVKSSQRADIFDECFTRAVREGRVATKEVGEWSHFDHIQDWIEIQADYFLKYHRETE